MAATQINLYEAKTQLSSLVERAAKGEEIIIAKSGKAMARLLPLATVSNSESEPRPLRVFGQNVLGITILSEDWEDDIPLEYFENPEKDRRLAEASKRILAK